MPRKQSPETQIRSLNRQLAEVRESAQQSIKILIKDRDEWRLAAETWKSAYEGLVKQVVLKAHAQEELDA